MGEEFSVFDLIKTVILWLCPLVFVEGLLLLLLRTDEYTKLENILGKEIGGIKKKVAREIENNIDFFHLWLLSNKNIVGLIALICSAIFFVVLRK